MVWAQNYAGISAGISVCHRNVSSSGDVVWLLFFVFVSEVLNYYSCM